MLERGSALSSSMFALIGLLEFGFVLRDSCIGFKQALLYRNFCVRNIIEDFARARSARSKVKII